MQNLKKGIRTSKKLRLHIRKVQNLVKQLYLNGNGTDFKIAKLYEESIGLSIFQYNVSKTDIAGHKKVALRLREIEKEIKQLQDNRNTPIMVYATT